MAFDTTCLIHGFGAQIFHLVLNLGLDLINQIIKYVKWIIEMNKGSNKTTIWKIWYQGNCDLAILCLVQSQDVIFSCLTELLKQQKLNFKITELTTEFNCWIYGFTSEEIFAISLSYLE